MEMYELIPGIELEKVAVTTSALGKFMPQPALATAGGGQLIAKKMSNPNLLKLLSGKASGGLGSKIKSLGWLRNIAKR